MASPSRRLQTKPVITCFKSVLLIYTFIFWVRDGDSGDGRGPRAGVGEGVCDPEPRELGSEVGREARGGLGRRSLLGPRRWDSTSGSGISPARVGVLGSREAESGPEVPSVRILCGAPGME